MKAFKHFRPAPRSGVIQSKKNAAAGDWAQKIRTYPSLSEPKNIFVVLIGIRVRLLTIMGLGKARIPTDKSYQTRPNSTKLDISRSAFPDPQSAIRTPQLTTPQPVVVAAESATNSGTKTAPIFAASFGSSVDSQPLTEIREPTAVPDFFPFFHPNLCEA